MKTDPLPHRIRAYIRQVEALPDLCPEAKARLIRRARDLLALSTAPPPEDDLPASFSPPAPTSGPRPPPGRAFPLL